MSKAKKDERTFEGTSRKGGPFKVVSSLTNDEAITKLRAMNNDFAGDCADQIEIMSLRKTVAPSVAAKMRVRENLVAWGFKLCHDADNRVTLRLPDVVLHKVVERKPMAFVAGEFPVHIRRCGAQSKHVGKFQITDGTGFGGAFYGYATSEGDWTPTRATPQEVIDAIMNRK